LLSVQYDERLETLHTGDRSVLSKLLRHLLLLTAEDNLIRYGVVPDETGSASLYNNA